MRSGVDLLAGAKVQFLLTRLVLRLGRAKYEAGKKRPPWGGVAFRITAAWVSDRASGASWRWVRRSRSILLAT